mmetsp:Transcript_61888/g.116490  ORF Transcript_61888/g.116490 Transcript_61888/m.116490 type:complete len:395 (-) Transcript_61888:170-1354(-)
MVLIQRPERGSANCIAVCLASKLGPVVFCVNQERSVCFLLLVPASALSQDQTREKNDHAKALPRVHGVPEAHDGDEDGEELSRHGEGDEDDGVERADDVEDEELPDGVGEAKQREIHPHLRVGAQEGHCAGELARAPLSWQQGRQAPVQAQPGRHERHAPGVHHEHGVERARRPVLFCLEPVVDAFLRTVGVPVEEEVGRHEREANEPKSQAVAVVVATAPRAQHFLEFLWGHKLRGDPLQPQAHEVLRLDSEQRDPEGDQGHGGELCARVRLPVQRPAHEHHGHELAGLGEQHHWEVDELQRVVANRAGEGVGERGLEVRERAREPVCVLPHRRAQLLFKGKRDEAEDRPHAGHAYVENVAELPAPLRRSIRAYVRRPRDLFLHIAPSKKGCV